MCARSLNKRAIVYYLTELFRLLEMRPLLRVAFIANAHSKMGKGGELDKRRLLIKTLTMQLYFLREYGKKYSSKLIWVHISIPN